MSRCIRLILLVCSIAAAVGVSWMYIQVTYGKWCYGYTNTIWYTLILAFLVLFNISYFLIFSFIPQIKNEESYREASGFVYLIITVFLVCALYAYKLKEPSMPIIAITYCSLLMPGAAMIMRGNFKYYQAVLLFCASMLVFLPGFILSVFLCNMLDFNIIGSMLIIFVPAIMVFLVLRLFFIIRKVPFTYVFLLLLSFFPAIPVGIILMFPFDS